MALRLEGIIHEAVARSAGKDWHASWARLESNGFPFSMRMTALQPTVVWEDDGAEITWQGSELVIIANPFDPADVSLVLPRSQDLAVETPSRRHAVGIAVVHGRAAIGLASGDVDAVDIELEEVTVISGEGAALATVGALNLDSAISGDGQGMEIFLEMTDLAIGSESDEPVESVVARMRVVGALPRQGAARERVDAWRRAGGYVDLEALVLEWPPVVARGKGRLALDGKNRPIGALRFDIIGYREIISALTSAGRLHRDQATILVAALDFMAGPPVDGHRRLDVDLSMQHGRLSVGPFTVMRLAPLWPPP